MSADLYEQESISPPTNLLTAMPDSVKAWESRSWGTRLLMLLHRPFREEQEDLHGAEILLRAMGYLMVQPDTIRDPVAVVLLWAVFKSRGARFNHRQMLRKP